MTEIKAVCFDVGGVLTTGIGVAMAEAARAGGVDLAGLGPRLRELFIDEEQPNNPGHALERGEISFDEFVGAVGDAGRDIWTLMHPDSPHCMYHHISRAEPMHAFVDEVGMAGYATGIVSNVVLEWMDLWAVFTRPIERFDMVIYSCIDGLRKPNPDIFRTALHRLGMNAHEVLYLDDGPMMIDVARRVGMRAVLVEDHDEAIAEARKILAI